MLILSHEDVLRCLTVAEAIPLMAQAFRAVSAGQGVYPLRTHITLADGAGDALFMPAYDGGAYLGLKEVTVQRGNPERYGLPSVRALYLFLDAQRGEPLALMEAGALTEVRTGAAGGLAADVLARVGASTVALFGAGRQARTQLQALQAVRPIRAVRLFSRDRARAEAFVAEMGMALGPEVEVRRVETPQEAVRGAEVIITATSATTPVFDGDDLEAGAHVTGVGSYTAAMREVDGRTVRRALVVVDALDAALAEAGDLLGPLREGLITQDHFSTELGQVLLGRRPGRTSDEQITFFKSVGLAAQDVFAAAAIYRRAGELGIGTTVRL